jgi:hypothetical protein
MRMMARRIAFAAVVTLVLPLATAPLSQGLARAASGEENAAIGKITLLNRQAIEEYRKLSFDEAQRLLDQALDIAAGAGLTQHPIRARTYVTLGVVTVGGLKRRDVAVRLFRKALQIQPEIQLSAELATAEVQAAFDEAVQGLGSEPRLERLPSELLVHEPITSGNRGDTITIAVTPDDALHVDRLTLAYRPAGASTFSKIKMQKQADGVFEGVIPAPATAGAEVAYYIEARDLDDRMVSSRGSPLAPLVVALAERAGGSGGAGVAPGAAATMTGGPTREPSAARGEARFLFALLAGSGASLSSGSGEATGYPISGSKLGWAKLGHLIPQIGYLATPHLLISLWGRLQLVRGADEYHTPAGSSQCGDDGACTAARGAFAGFASATWLFGDAGSTFRPYLSLSAGGGYVRQIVRVNAADDDCGADRQQPTCRDTAALGPFLGGPGLGFHLRLSSAARLVLAVQGLVGAPRFTADLDANVGVAFLM